MFVNDAGANSPVDGGANFTISGWFKHKNFDYFWDHFFYKRKASANGGSPNNAFAIEINSASGQAANPFPRGSSGTGSAVTLADNLLDKWGYVTFVYDGATCRVYENGVLRGTVAITSCVDNDAPLVFGNNTDVAIGSGDAAWNGWIDEVRFSKGSKSGAWVAAEYAAMMSGGLLSAGDVQILSAVARPAFAPATPWFHPSTSVTLTCATDGAAIYYTTDGSDPTESSALYTGPILISSTTTIKARAYKADLDPSAIATATYTYAVPAPPAFGTVTATPDATKVTISGTIASVGNYGATACDVYFALGTSAESLPGMTKIASGATTSFNHVIRGLLPETTYYYALSISNNAVTVRGAATSGSFTTPVRPESFQPVPGDPVATRQLIQEALDDAAGETPVGTVVLGEGLFEIDAQLMVTNGVTLQGRGWEKTIIKQVATTASANTRCATVSGGSKLVGVTLTGGKTAGNWEHGAGVVVNDGTVSWCCISNNLAMDRNIYGGGVNIAKGTIDHSIVAFNRAGSHTSCGGGIGSYNATGPIVIDACLVYGNTVSISDTSGKGGGVNLISGNQDVAIRNTTIAGNSATSTGGGIEANAKLKLVNSIVWGNTAASGDPNVSGTPAHGSSNNLIGGSPAFVDAANRNYHLSGISPAIHAGVTYTGIGVDLDGMPFVGTPSIGCYEFGRVGDPVFNPPATTYSQAFDVTVTTATPGAAIHYTIDGSDPTEESALCEGPISITGTGVTTVKARAYKEDLEPSIVATAIYAYALPAPPVLGPLTVTTRQTKATISGAITSVGNNGATWCDVYLAIGTSPSSLPEATKVVSGATTSIDYVIPGLTAGTTYYYTLSISNNAISVLGAATSGSFSTLPKPDPLQPVVGDAAANRQLIQQAIDAAADEMPVETVVLGEGLFEIDAQLMVTGGVTLVGQGWDKTILKQTTSGSNARCVTLDGGATVRKVTLTGGRVTGGNYTFGGGVWVKNGTISWCCITNNSLTTANTKYGGGVGFYQGKGQVDHSVIADNLAQTATGTDVTGGGIGIYQPSGAITIDSCLIRGNRAIYTGDHTGKGGGIGINFLNWNNPVTVRNTTIVENVAGENGGQTAAQGGAVYTTTDTSKLTMLNCIVADNTTVNTNTTVQLSYAGGVDYCLFDTAADLVGGSNCKSGDPMFKTSAKNKYHLAEGSPAIYAGVAYEGIGNDLDDRPFAAKPSMGCYEFGKFTTVFLVR